MNRDGRYVLLAFIGLLVLAMIVCALAACTDMAPRSLVEIVDAPTDVFVAPDALTGPDTWYHAYLAWEQIDCEHTQRCDPQTLEVLFDGSIPDCVEYLAQQDCNRLDPMHGPVNCITNYPHARWPLVAECAVEVRTLACGIDPPASCETAFDPGTP